jgi:phosphoglycolate phosphatase-like HAD superfamily hydrolase
MPAEPRSHPDPRVVLAFDIDGTLIDTRRSFTAIVREVSGASDQEIERFRDTGGFNDDWELARGLCCWIGAGRPDVVERFDGVQDAILWCAHDPGCLSARCIARYRGTPPNHEDGLWRQEDALVAGPTLTALAGAVTVVACTGRDAWELARAEELLGHRFAASTTMEQARKPDPQALLRLVPPEATVVALFGDTHADRRCVLAARRARPALALFFVHATPTRPLAPALEEAATSGAAWSPLQWHDWLARHAEGA